MKTQLFIVLAALFCASAAAQTIGVAPVKIWTHNYEVRNPMGFGVSISKSIGIVTIKGEYVFAKSERTYNGYLAGGFMTLPLPPTENVKSTSSFSAYEFSLAIAVLGRRSDFNLDLGFGYSFDSFSADRTGLTSGQKATLDGGTKNGAFISFSAEYFVLKPMSVELSYRIKSLSRGNMATDIELPFVDLTDVRELQLSVAYHLN